jgi:hypothetical protein
MSWILKLFSLKAERETGERLVSSLTDTDTVEGSKRRAKSGDEDVQDDTSDKPAGGPQLRIEWLVPAELPASRAQAAARLRPP